MYQRWLPCVVKRIVSSEGVVDTPTWVCHVLGRHSREVLTRAKTSCGPSALAKRARVRSLAKMYEITVRSPRVFDAAMQQATIGGKSAEQIGVETGSHAWASTGATACDPCSWRGCRQRRIACSRRDGLGTWGSPGRAPPAGGRSPRERSWGGSPPRLLFACRAGGGRGGGPLGSVRVLTPERRAPSAAACGGGGRRCF